MLLEAFFHKFLHCVPTSIASNKYAIVSLCWISFLKHKCLYGSTNANWIINEKCFSAFAYPCGPQYKGCSQVYSLQLRLISKLGRWNKMIISWCEISLVLDTLNHNSTVIPT